MNSSYHPFYIACSLIAALLAAVGIVGQIPILYGIVPGLIGGISAGVAAVQFFREKRDLAGFAANISGFVFYQAFQANPAMLPEFTTYIAPIPLQDQVVGIVLSNLTVAMLLGAYHGVRGLLGSTIERWVPTPATVTRDQRDHAMATGFVVLFTIIAIPNILYGKLIVGSIETIMYQRAAGAAGGLGGYNVGSELGGSLVNITLWTTSLFFLWVYLLRSRFKVMMWLLGPLVLIWTTAVALQGSRTYLVTMAAGAAIYYLGSPNTGKKVLIHACWVVPLVFALNQATSLFRNEGLVSVDTQELTSHFFEIRGNEGAQAEMDGIEYFRTELLARGLAPNPLTGFLNGLFFRPIDGALMIVPRSVFPWKPDDRSATEYNLFYQNVRQGVESDEATLGASAGLVGRELVRHGFLGPLTMLFWMGLLLVVAEAFFSKDPNSDFLRIFASGILAFFFAQSRDFMPVWFIPFLPLMIIMAIVIYGARNTGQGIPQASASLPTGDGGEGPS